MRTTLALLAWLLPVVALAQGIDAPGVGPRSGGSGSGGSPLTTTDGTHTVTSTTTQTFGACTVVGGSAGSATINVTAPVEAAQTSSFPVAATDMCKTTPVNISGGGTITLPSSGAFTTVFGSGQTWCGINIGATADTITNSTGGTMYPTVTSLPPNGWSICLQSDGASLYATLSPPDLLTLANVWAAQQSMTMTTLTIASTTYTPTGASNDYYILLTSACASAACILANYSSVPPAGTHGLFKIKQPASGGPASFGTYGSQYIAPGGTASITLSTAANAIDVLSYFSDGTSVYLAPTLNFSH